MSDVSNVRVGEAAKRLGVGIGLVRRWIDEYLADPLAEGHMVRGFALPRSGQRRIYESSITECRERIHGV